MHKMLQPVVWRASTPLLLHICTIVREPSSEVTFDRETHLHAVFPGTRSLPACHLRGMRIIDLR